MLATEPRTRIGLPRWYAGLGLGRASGEAPRRGATAPLRRVGPFEVARPEEGADITVFGSLHQPSAVLFDGFLFDRRATCDELRLSRAATHAEIVAAAFERFARYGFRRTSLGDIAREAGISRPAVYLHFPNKQAIFRAAASVMHERALAAASQAAQASGGIQARIGQILAAKLGSFFEIAHGSAHVGEILDENSRLCGDISEAARRRYLRILRGVIDEATRRGEIAPAAAITPSAIGRS